MQAAFRNGARSKRRARIVRSRKSRNLAPVLPNPEPYLPEVAVEEVDWKDRVEAVAVAQIVGGALLVEVEVA